MNINASGNRHADLEPDFSLLKKSCDLVSAVLYHGLEAVLPTQDQSRGLVEAYSEVGASHLYLHFW